MPIAITLAYLLIMPWLYRNAGLTRVCEHLMRARLAFGIV